MHSVRSSRGSYVARRIGNRIGATTFRSPLERIQIGLYKHDEAHRRTKEDWLRDNYHVVREQIREVRRDLPRKYYIQLPKLAQGRAAGLPRVYEIARELVDHTAGRLDFDTLIEFVAAYQGGAPLPNIGREMLRRVPAPSGNIHSSRKGQPVVDHHNLS